MIFTYIDMVNCFRPKLHTNKVHVVDS